MDCPPVIPVEPQASATSFTSRARVGEDRRRLVELAMQRRHAAAQVVVIHSGKIIVHQRECMDEFDRCGW
jgi:hypothetical protein